MSITHISTTTQLDGILSKSKDKLTVIDFHAQWCGPCKIIAPTFEALSKQFKNVNFLKCDVDDAQPVAQRYSVAAMPTFLFLKGSDIVDEVKGANSSALKAAVERHSSGSTGGSGAFSGTGQTLGGSSAGGSAGSIINLTPQTKVMLGLIGAYLLLCYFS
ncbi:thioredoxin-domain-containing protein [Phellopilus nigrolimitatus]|nr:thioredoxin-domain-containing protein [Phellopilus nigrolimitatus]